MIFKAADVIVSVGADFLGDWQGGGFDSDYAKNTEFQIMEKCLSTFSLNPI